MIGWRAATASWLAAASLAHAESRIQWVPAGERGAPMAVEVTGLDAPALAAAHEWPVDKLRTLLSVRVQQDAAPAMLGTWQVKDGAVRFIPQFPLTPGVSYRAEFDPSLLPGGVGLGKLTTKFTMPEPPRGAGTSLTQLYPSGEQVPENLLKFYLHFSAPMSRGHIYDHIHLLDDRGREVDLPFLELDEELWDPEMKRLTLFIDPGRIKREVKPLEDVGPALEAGRRFTLIVDAALHDAAGHPLIQKHERTFRVGPPDRTPISPAAWKVSPPAADSATVLRLEFSEAMDHALALRLLRVIGPDGNAVAGTPSLSDAEQTWNFTPAEPWQPGGYEIVVPAILEDLAGNNVGKAFEVEMLARGERVEQARTERVRFEVK